MDYRGYVYDAQGNLVRDDDPGCAQAPSSGPAAENTIKAMIARPPTGGGLPGVEGFIGVRATPAAEDPSQTAKMGECKLVDCGDCTYTVDPILHGFMACKNCKMKMKNGDVKDKQYASGANIQDCVTRHRDIYLKDNTGEDGTIKLNIVCD
jgi:hypothetical protein